MPFGSSTINVFKLLFDKFTSRLIFLFCTTLDVFLIILYCIGYFSQIELLFDLIVP